MSQFAKKLKTEGNVSFENQDENKEENIPRKLPCKEDRQPYRNKEIDFARANSGATCCKDSSNSSFISAAIFIVPEGIQSKRYELITGFAFRNGFDCQEVFSDRVSHIVTELKDINQLVRLYPALSKSIDLKILSIQWLHTCVREKALVSEENFLVPGYEQWLASIKIKVLQTASHTFAVERNTNDSANFSKEVFNKNVLERNAPLNHCNQKLVEPLAFLNDYWTVMGDERRALAYAKAAATIKCLPVTVKNMSEVDNLKGLGSGHGLKVIQEVLETGRCEEVIVKKDSENFQILKNLSTVYGIGPTLALKLHTTHKINSVEDLITHWSQLDLADERIKIGVAYHSDLNTPVSLDIAKKIKEIVNIELSKIKEGYVLELAGGFRRGKTIGHDVDLLISYNKIGDEVGVLPRLMKQLNLAGYILHSRFEKSSYNETMYRKSNQQLSTMDHFEKCFCIFKCPRKGLWLLDFNNSLKEADFNLDFKSISAASNVNRLWQAVRVDLVVIPKEQWAYGLLGWTGSKLFMRMLRHYSNTILKKTLNSHGLWDSKEMKLLPAETEEEVFKHLELSYKDPVLRNF
ncbi:DNA-directed DNA/RNA polymerase mu-like [Palaemon carinicauda]|uniref:DNA-directed DNA/RNA polymerase mu-like n=1 Tax=Palaemon carinicauda TaxID=392227 RepID=UPI0035B5F8B6